MFKASFRENIDPNNFYTEDQIWTAIELVGLEETIQKASKGNLDSEITSRFNPHHFTLVVSILHKNRIVVLYDDNLDITTDTPIQSALNDSSLLGSGTVFFVTNRRDTLLGARKACVIKAGRGEEYATIDKALAFPHSALRQVYATMETRVLEYAENTSPELK